MRPAAPRRLVVLIAVTVLAYACTGAETGPRAKPSRPSSPGSSARAATPRSAYLSVSDVATRLGLRASSTEAGRRVSLSDGTRRLELEADSRECEVNGLRVFLGSPVIARRGQLQVSELDYAACLVPMLRPALAANPPRRPRVIAIDPGHGGSDNGTQNPRLGLKEKNCTLDVALRLKKLLEARSYRVVLTRDSDERVELLQRAVTANRANADLFLSIHFNSLANDAKTRGTEVFTFPPQYQRSTNSWGPTERDDTENEAAPINRHDVWSVAFAHALHRELVRDLKTFDRGKKIMHLGMLRGVTCAGALVESGFLSNDDEARKIATPAYRQQIAAALAEAVEQYSDLVQSLGRRS